MYDTPIYLSNVQKDTIGLQPISIYTMGGVKKHRVMEVFIFVSLSSLGAVELDRVVEKFVQETNGMV